MKSILRTAAAGLAIASLGIASSASAALTATADASAEIVTSLSVTVLGTDRVLNFGSLSDGGVSGSVDVVLEPDGTISACGLALQCGGSPDSPTFNILGGDDALVYLYFVNTTTPLENPLDNSIMMASNFTTSETADQITLDPSGQGSFSIGGTLTVGASQTEGVYAGEVEVRVAYN